MTNLIKYELRKTWITKAILLAVTLAVEAVFLIGLYTDNNNEITGMMALLLFLLATGGILVIGLESVVTLHRDTNTKQSYMLFMTPNSCYKILGAKVLECGCSILIAGAFYFALGALDITLLFAKEGELSRLWETIQEFLSRLTVNGQSLTLDAKLMGCVAFELLTSWLGVVTRAYLAVVVCAALLGGKKFNGVLSFLLFLVLSWLVGWVCRTATEQIRDMYTVFFTYSLIQLVFSATMYVCTAAIMERKLSV